MAISSLPILAMSSAWTLLMSRMPRRFNSARSRSTNRRCSRSINRVNSRYSFFTVVAPCSTRRMRLRQGHHKFAKVVLRASMRRSVGGGVASAAERAVQFGYHLADDRGQRIPRSTDGGDHDQRKNGRDHSVLDRRAPGLVFPEPGEHVGVHVMGPSEILSSATPIRY